MHAETTSTDPAATPDGPAHDPLWKRQIAPYLELSPARTALDLLTGPVAYLALWPLMLLSLHEVGYWLALLISVPAAGFLLRTFILFHDATHGSLFASRRLNLWAGRVLGLLVLHPFAAWRHSHAVHHGAAGDLDRRGTGDVETLTIEEFRSAPRGRRLAYRAFRNPLVMFGIGPIWSLVVQPRIPPSGPKRLRKSVWLTNLAVAVMVAAACLAVGWLEFLMLFGPMVMMAGVAGVWLFFVQHQFEDAYWESGENWSYADAALEGSSYLKLPQPLQFFTGNIGLHHVHHLNARIPNYNLQAAHDNVDAFRSVPILTFGESLRCHRFKLVDEQTGQLLTWAQAREAVRRREGGPAAVPAPEWS